MRGTWRRQISGVAVITASRTNSQLKPTDSKTTAINGDITTPTSGPTTATSPVFSVSPNAACQAIQAATPSEIPLPKRMSASSSNVGATAEARLAATPITVPITKTERTGRRNRPPTHDASTNPASCAVDIHPTVLSATSYSSETAESRNGVAVKTAVLDAMATRRAAGTDGRAAARTRTGTWNATSEPYRRSVAELATQVVASGADQIAHLGSQGGHVIHRQALGADRFEHAHFGFCVSETPIVLAKRISRAVHRERQDRNLMLDREAERSDLNSRSSPVFERVPSGKIITDTFEFSRSLDATSADEVDSASPRVERDVAGETHHPTDEWDAQDLDLRHPLHLGRQVRDQQDVHEALVVRHDDVRATHVVGERPRRCGTSTVA